MDILITVRSSCCGPLSEPCQVPTIFCWANAGENDAPADNTARAILNSIFFMENLLWELGRICAYYSSFLLGILFQKMGTGGSVHPTAVLESQNLAGGQSSLSPFF